MKLHVQSNSLFSQILHAKCGSKDVFAQLVKHQNFPNKGSLSILDASGRG